MYKINLSDSSYIIANKEYILHLFSSLDDKFISLEDYLNNKFLYENYYLKDKIDDKEYKRTFNIEEIEDINIPSGTRLKNIQDIRQFDLVMGPDGLPRKVIDLHSGEDDMFEIETEEGIKHIVNGDHTLVLVNKENDNDKTTISVKGYLNMDNSFKDKYKLMKVNF